MENIRQAFILIEREAKYFLLKRGTKCRIVIENRSSFFQFIISVCFNYVYAEYHVTYGHPVIFQEMINKLKKGQTIL